jgi:very-short-patch-repair endonuclease
MTEKEKFAKKLRENPTESERILNSKLLEKGWSFEFQFLLSGYIPDFYFPEKKKIVELDGKAFHDPKKDKLRDSRLKKQGIKILRIKSWRVFRELDFVLEEIEAFVFGVPVKKRKKKSKKVRFKRLQPDELTEQFRFITDGL